jgi:hypothetical protein
MRQDVVWRLLAASPLLLLMALLLAASGHRFLATLPVVACVSLFLALTAWDLTDWVSALRGARRMKRGVPPASPGIDYGVGDDRWVRTIPAADPYRAQPRRELLALGSPAAAARLLGRNLLARMGVVFVLACGAQLMLLDVCHPLPAYSYGTTRTALHTLRSAVLLYRAGHRDRACPTVSQLVAAGTLERGFRADDAWGRPMKIICEDDGVTVRSAGHDGKEGTADDIVVPPPVDASFDPPGARLPGGCRSTSELGSR